LDEAAGNRLHAAARHRVSAPTREHQTYLRVAELVLASAVSPLKVREIVERGIERGLFSDHALSQTPEKSMQARLSMDILKKKDDSNFVRIAPGRFTLRSKIRTENSTEAQHAAPYPAGAGEIGPLKEYIAKPRILRTPTEEVLCVPETSFRTILTFQGIETDAAPILTSLLADQNTRYIMRSESEDRDDAKQFVTYVLVQCGQRLLYFRRSYLSRAAEFLRGSKCIAFGGHVTAADADMLSRSDRGLSNCARRELAEELSWPSAPSDRSNSGAAHQVRGSHALPRRTNSATARLFQDAPLELLGVLNDDSSEVGRRHFAVVYRSWITDWSMAQQLERGDSSLKGLSWLDITKDKVDISEYEYWSQLCLRKFYPSNVISRSGFKIVRNAGTMSGRAIVVAGRIGSGKSETASYLSQQLGYGLLRSGLLLQGLMGSPPLSEIGREEFQVRAQRFIETQDGPRRLAAHIAHQIADAGFSRCIIDGIRHLATFEHLSELRQNDVALIFVQTPPDVAYSLYRARETPDDLAFSYRDFLKIYDAPVEQEIPSLGRRAHVYIYNAFGIEPFRRTLDEVAQLFKPSKSDD
jgi:predicted NUDIX family phosphoesterase/dephospho-CoA kinase